MILMIESKYFSFDEDLTEEHWWLPVCWLFIFVNVCQSLIDFIKAIVLTTCCGAGGASLDEIEQIH